MGRIGDAFRALTSGSRRDLAAEEIGWQFRNRGLGSGKVRVTADSALRHSAVWACGRLRADLVSMMPVDVFRTVGGIQVEVTKPGWLDEPFPGQEINEFLWATQFDLDRYGNTFGLITQVDSKGRPAQIELLPAGETSVTTNGRRVKHFTVNGEKFDPALIWHEKQYAPAGSPLGLSPIAYAAWSIGGYLSAQQFALDWYSSGASPSGVLRNSERTIPKEVSAAARAEFKAAVEGRDVFVTGKDWTWTPAQGDANSAAFLDEMKYGIGDVCRFMGVPGDMIDAPADGATVTYANVTQRNVQLLVMNLGAAINRREHRLSRALAKPRFVKLNTDAVLRMDPETRSRVLTDQINSRRITPSEARALDNRQPLGDTEFAEFDRLFGAPKASNPEPAQARYESPWVITEVRDLPRAAIGSGWALPGS